MSNKLIPTAMLAVLTTITIHHSAIAETQQTKSKQTMDQNMTNPAKGMEKCYGIAKAGQNDCGTANHMCAGESTINNDKEGWVYAPTGLCNRIVGGTTKPPATKS